MAMAGDPGVKAYAGGVPLNTYNFFGRHAIAVGIGATPAGGEERVRQDEARRSYLRIVVKDGRLQGIFGVNEFFDGGVMRQLILRRVDISGRTPSAGRRSAHHRSRIHVSLVEMIMGQSYATIAFDAVKCDGCLKCMSACALAKTGENDSARAHPGHAHEFRIRARDVPPVRRSEMRHGMSSRRARERW